MNYENFLHGIKKFYDKRENKNMGPGSFCFTPGLEPTYWASSYPAIVFSLTGILEEIDDEYKKEWLRYLKNGQNPQTGFFNEPITLENQPESEIHKAEDLLWHGATFIIGAMHVLGGRPLHPFSVINQYKEPGEMEKWLENLDWTSPWKAGNWTYDMGCIIGSDFEITGDKRNKTAMDEFFEWHNLNTDHETGWWNPKGNAPLFSQQFGGYHSLMVYWMFDKEVPDPEKMIKSSISLQSSNGSYMNYGCCGDMDVIDTIVTLSRQYDICHREVKSSVEKFYPYLLNLWDKDGGFINLKNDYHIDLGWKLHKGEYGRADACSTYFRTYTLSLIDEILHLNWLSNLKWKHMDGFSHGIRPKSMLEKK